MTRIKIAVMRAVREGHCTPVEVAQQTGLAVEAVMAAAGCLRGDGEHPELLCCLDGEPWALTVEGRRIIERIGEHVRNS